jgi:hypothetical protein
MDRSKKTRPGNINEYIAAAPLRGEKEASGNARLHPQSRPGSRGEPEVGDATNRFRWP